MIPLYQKPIRLKTQWQQKLLFLVSLRGGEGDNRFNQQNNNSHVHHTILYISLPFLHNYDVKIPYFAFYGERKQAKTKFYFLFKLGYRKIPKISPGAYIFQRPFLRGLFLEGLIFGGAYLRREICVSKPIGLPSQLEVNLPFLLCFTVKPVLSGHPQGMLQCPLNTGCPPNTGFERQRHMRCQMPFK